MFDANGVICTDVHKASLELLTASEIKKMSVCRIFSTIVFDAGGPKAGGLHDPAMGSLDPKVPCDTCGCRRDCPGHLGHIELPLPLFHPTLVPSIVRLLKALCFRCRRLKIDPRTASVFVKKFQLSQNDMWAELEQFGMLHGKLSKEGRTKKQSTEEGEDVTESSAIKRVQLIKIFTKLQQKQAARNTIDASFLTKDISESQTSVENWSIIRSDFFKAAMTRTNCSHCGRSFKTSIRQASQSAGIDISWPHGSEKPFSQSTWKQMAINSSETGLQMTGGDSEDDDAEEVIQHGKRGKVTGSLHLQAYQLHNLFQAVWSSPDKALLEFLYPMSIKNGYEIFFLRNLPVSANRFRPLTKNDSFSGGDGEGSLHNRTSGLIDILTVCEKITFALSVLRNADPMTALMESEVANDPSGVPMPGVTDVDKSKLKKIIEQHQGNYKLLSTYSRDLQATLNAYIDSTKALQQRGKIAPPGIRQWMERKQGAIRQKMMGKRVNFAARTVIAPDNSINTNEIGIPVEFAKKLTIPEYVTAQSAAYLRKLVENGPDIYPGANMLEEPGGAVYDLKVMNQSQRQTRGRLLMADVAQGNAPRIVYRHVRDGDVVIMNRQPTLHRASMLAHFVRVLQGWKTFRMMYVNCGSYNADFDGDEMNMHLPQDLCSRSEAQQIVNADCHYVTAKNGEPLRGLIQDHVLGGNFLTCRGTFLDVDQYYTLLYTGMSAFVDRGDRIFLSANMQRGKASNVASAASSLKVTGDPGFKVLALETLKVVVEPPTIWKPKKLWTGKQVISSIIKTLIDSIARAMYTGPEFQAEYKGLNFTSKSKTPGDVWGGVLDGDKEESTIIIRNSELLQGVFDKSMFGASSFGLVHLCYEILGARVSGILLSVFAKTFTCYLQMRGFSCCTGDFLMTPQGERNREKMIMHCTLAGNYLQEIFVDSINRHMQWKDSLGNSHSFSKKLETAHEMLQTQLSGKQATALFNTKKEQLNRQLELDSRIDCQGFPADPEFSNRYSYTSTGKIEEKDITKDHGVNYAIAATMNSDRLALTATEKEDVCQWKTQGCPAEDSQPLSKKIKVKLESDAGSKDKTDLMQRANPWDVCRRLHCPLPMIDWRHKEPDQITEEVRKLVNRLIEIGSSNKRLQHVVLEALAKSPEIALYFPRVAQAVGAVNLWGPELKNRIVNNTSMKHPPLAQGRIGPPRPNHSVTLPSGKVILGDGSLRLPQLFHPSWLFEDSTGLQFEDTKRYTMSMALIRNRQDLTNFSEAAGAKPFCPRPNELTRQRLEMLSQNHFRGRESILMRMMDKFFQSGMGKLTSKNNDSVSGKVTLYKFPFNGFSSMITTGAKGSKVNFAMICGMLSQQSLEGRRVPVMVSGKTLPSFAPFDLGARAGGLITDRYLTGLRPQEYFFHCMAGREGLVDTAVKTANSGYLQRCVMKGMEGVMVQYDGTVRDSDGTIVQFLYGEDGVDVSKASYSGRLNDILQNPAIARAKYAALPKVQHKSVSASLETVKHFFQEQDRLLKSQGDQSDSDLLHRCVSPLDPISNVYPPAGYVGSTSEKYRRTVNSLVRDDIHSFIPATVMAERRMRGKSNLSAPFTPDEIERARTRMENVLNIKYSETLCAAGEGVGCISAQSMGEPATQMTLNTFHLAGHGAANVTLGIPRLREILQTAGNAKTPFLYIPIKGDTADDAAKHAELVLLGFKRIPLTDVIHAVGVESNVYHQPENCRSGLPEYQMSLYKDNVDQILAPKFFWEYEMTIQFENLDHFHKVVPKFTPQKILALTVNRVIRDMMRQVNKLIYIYATKYAEEELDSEDDELEAAAERFVFERHVRSHFTRRDQRKERARVAGVGFGTKGTTDLTGDMDLLTGVDVAETFKRKSEKEAGDDKESAEIEAKEEDANSDAMPDSDHSGEDDSEKEFSESELGDDGIQEKDDLESENEIPNETAVSFDDSDEEMEDGMIESEKGVMLKRRQAQEEKQAEVRRLRALKSKWKGISLDYDRIKGILQSEKLIEPEGEELEAEAMWSDADRAACRIKPLPSEAFRFLTDLKICRKTWRVVVKFGWPMEKCPRRVVVLESFVRVLKKYSLQDTPGVKNPKIVGGENTESGAQYEVQCEGSNFGWIHRLKDSCVDHNRITTNDIKAIFQFYGIEACRQVLIRELNKVFSVYGITVDYRHMSLIGDAMTHSGLFRSFSRLGIRHHSSPLLQMSFETSMKFLTEAIERGAYDDLRTPAGSIVCGKPALVGSGMCDVLSRINFGKDKKEKSKKPTAKRPFSFLGSTLQNSLT